MLRLIRYLLVLIDALTADRARLALEVVMLKQQLQVYQRSEKRPKIEPADRTFWTFMVEVIEDWARSLTIVSPETVIRWHREAARRSWTKKCLATRKLGRPPIPRAEIKLIQRLSREKSTWGAPRISEELAMLGQEVCATTVAKYMKPAAPSPRKRQSWRTFLANHLTEAAACDFFTLPGLDLKMLYVFVVLSHDRRRIDHINVTRRPTPEWTALQIRQAFPGGDEPRFLHRDRDAIYGDAFEQAIKSMGIEQVVSAKRSPWQNPFVERVIGSIRREGTDHIIPLSERHLLRVLREYVDYYNHSRAHLSLDGNAPEPREVERQGMITTTPVLGGLHHRYCRAA